MRPAARSLDLDSGPSGRARRRRGRLRLVFVGFGGLAVAAAGVLSLVGGQPSAPRKAVETTAAAGNTTGERTSATLALPSAGESAAALGRAILPPTHARSLPPVKAPSTTKDDAPPSDSSARETQSAASARLDDAGSTGFASLASLTGGAEQPIEPIEPKAQAPAIEVKPASRVIEPRPTEWQTLTVQSGDNLAALFQRAGFSARDVHEVVNADKRAKALTRLYPGDEIRLEETADGELVSVRYQLSDTETLVLSRGEDGFETRVETRTLERRATHASAVIHHSLFSAGARVGLPDNLIMELAAIFGWDVDFALDIRAGDAFTVIYEELYRDGEKLRNGNILAAEFVNQGEVFRAVRYEHENGEAKYYAPDGRSMRKEFLRSPVNFARVTSNFNPQRLHPVLGVKRPHMGTDYGAAPGTPIKAAGDGRIIHRGRKGGYGRTVIIKHGSRYTTLYAHMSGYKRGQRTGSQVEQGDIIGYVGASGMVTGPHLHYEFRINGVHRNPRTVELPEADPIPEALRADFEQTTAPRLERLTMLSRTRLASATADNSE